MAGDAATLIAAAIGVMVPGGAAVIALRIHADRLKHERQLAREDRTRDVLADAAAVLTRTRDTILEALMVGEASQPMVFPMYEERVRLELFFDPAEAVLDWWTTATGLMEGALGRGDYLRNPDGTYPRFDPQEIPPRISLASEAWFEAARITHAGRPNHRSVPCS